MPPEVSVVVTTKNRWPLLARALGGVLSQEGVDLEALVVDDGSSDSTLERLAANSDPRIRVIRHEQSMGVARSRNVGIAQARSPWVAFLDDDDIWSPKKLRAQLDAARSPDVVVSWTGIVVIDTQGEVVRIDAAAPADDLAKQILRRNLFGGPSGVMARTDVVRKVGGFDPGLSVLADWDLWIRLTAEGTGAPVPDLLTAYLVHPASMTAEASRRAVAELEVMAAKYSSRSLSALVDRAWFSNWLTDAQALGGRRRHAALMHFRTALRYRHFASARKGMRLMAGDRASRVLNRVRRSATDRRTLPRPPWLDLHFVDGGQPPERGIVLPNAETELH
jgi:GT2 family glycosyltransferase